MTTTHRVLIVTTWAGDGRSEATAFRPTVVDDHRPLSWSDQSGHDPKVGGTFTILADYDGPTYAALLANPKYAGKIAVTQ